MTEATNQPPAVAKLLGTLGLNAESLCAALAQPELHGLAPSVWYAIDAPQKMLDETPDHTLAAPLGLASHQLATLLSDAELGGRGRGATSWRKKLGVVRVLNDSQQPAGPVQLTLLTCQATNLKWIAFGTNELVTAPAEQLSSDSTLPQPPPAHTTRGRVATRKRQRSLRSAAGNSEDELPLPAKAPGHERGAPGGQC